MAWAVVDDGLRFSVHQMLGKQIAGGATGFSGVWAWLRNGERRAIVQARGAESFAPGDAVILVTTGGKVRISRAPAYAPQGYDAPLPRPLPGTRG